MQEKVLRRVITLGIVAILGLVGMQAYWVVTTWDLNDTEFSQKAKLALYGVARQIAAANEADLPSRDIIRQQSSNYFIVNIESEINAVQLETLMQEELMRLHLDVPFEYAIFDCTSDQMAYGAYCQAPGGNEEMDLDLTGSYLPPDKELLYYFGVKFPTRTGYIWEKMQLVFFLSVILALTVAFFIYSVIVILRQRRLAVMQKEFIDNMTHEFKTPLSTIRIAAAVFQRDERIQADGRLSRYAELIYQQYERLNEQVEKVLNISRIEKGSMEIKKERVDLQTLLPDLISGARARTEDSGGELLTDLPAGPLPLLADPVHLSNIIANLLDNAVKYSGGKAPQIELRGHRNGKQLRLEVKDQGAGIALEHQAKLFEKFFRVPTGDVHDVKGFGLGLFYVAQICKAHGWEITVDSTLGQGTTFTINLPLLSIPQVATT